MLLQFLLQLLRLRIFNAGPRRAKKQGPGAMAQELDDAPTSPVLSRSPSPILFKQAKQLRQRHSARFVLDKIRANIELRDQRRKRKAKAFSQAEAAASQHCKRTRPPLPSIVQAKSPAWWPPPPPPPVRPTPPRPKTRAEKRSPATKVVMPPPRPVGLQQRQPNHPLPPGLLPLNTWAKPSLKPLPPGPVAASGAASAAKPRTPNLGCLLLIAAFRMQAMPCRTCNQQTHLRLLMAFLRCALL